MLFWGDFSPLSPPPWICHCAKPSFCSFSYCPHCSLSPYQGTHLTTHLGSNKLLLTQDHPGSKEQHDSGVSSITEHHSKQEGEGGGGVQGWGVTTGTQ